MFQQIVVDSCRTLYTSIVIRIASTINLKFSTFLSKTVSSFQLSERNVISNLGWSLPRIAIFSLLTNNSNFVVMLFGKHRESSFPEEQCSHVCDYYEVYIFVCNATASQICNQGTINWRASSIPDVFQIYFLYFLSLFSPLLLSHFLPFPPWVSTSSDPRSQDRAINGTLPHLTSIDLLVGPGIQ